MMPFFHVDDGFHAHKKVARLGTEDFAALALWTVAGSWCSDQLTDGFVPDYVASRFHPDYKEFANALVRVGLWEIAEHEGESGWRFHDWSGPGRNPSADQVQRERAATAERQRKFRERVKGTAKPAESPEPQEEPPPDHPMDDDPANAVTNAVSHGDVAPVVTLPVPFPSVPFPSMEEPTTSSSEPAAPDSDQKTAESAQPKRTKKPEPQRDDVDALCTRLVKIMVDRGCREPTITEKWRQQARLLLDNDRIKGNRITLANAIALLEWSQHDEFWSTNIMSIPTFRKQYDKLRKKALAEWKRAHPRAVIDDEDEIDLAPNAERETQSPDGFGANVLPFQRSAPNDLGSDEHMARFLARQGIETRRSS